MRRGPVILVAALVLALAPGAAGAAPVGFGAGGMGAATLRGDALAAALASLDATWVRVDVRWDEVAPTRPAHPARMRDPAYRWAALDRLVRRLRGLRLAGGAPPRLLLAIGGMPDWAAVPPTGMPSPRAFAAFATAVARRHGRSAAAYELWPEPNSGAVMPQRLAGRLAAPAAFAGLVRAGARAVWAEDRAPVVAGGLARLDGAQGTPPRAFLRALGRVGLPRAVAVGLRLAPGGPERAATGDDLGLADAAAVVAAVDAAFPAPRALWVTGYGVPASAGDDAQAEGVAALLGAAASTRVRVALWDRLLDAPGAADGLLGADLAERPAAAAWRALRAAG